MLPILFIIAVLIAFYIYSTRNHDYWLKRNVKHDKPIPFFGNHFRNQFGICSITELSLEYYNRFSKEKVVGYYRGRTPELIIRDPEIVKRIMTVDFPYFYQRGIGRTPEVETILYSLFHVEGDMWKLLRQRLTPTFTTAKLKAMFPLIVKCAEKLQVVCQSTIDKGGVCDVREMMARFTTEFIGACGFGIEMDTINNENSLFRELGKLIFTRDLRNVLLMSCWELIPESRGLYSVLDPKVTVMMTDIVQRIRKQRNFKPSGRNDFIDLLLELEDKGTIKGESIEKLNSDGSSVEVQMEMELKYIVAQVFIFFAAGFETSSSTTSYTLHELAFNPDIQTKIQEEIDQVLAKYDNKLCYDAVAEMTLLELAFKESLRKFPSLGVLNRVCTRQYTIPELNITIDPGVKIMIPVQALQNDEKYFENPREFKPERFADRKHENKFVYLPFGEGPRACIGLRLGQMQSLAGLAGVLQKFSVEPAETTRRDLIVDHRVNVTQSVQGGIPLRLRPRKSKAV